MITYEEARRKALAHLADLEAEARKVIELRRDLSAREREVLGFGAEDEDPRLGLVEAATIAGDFGWVFFWQSQAYLETGDETTVLVGNAPLLIARADGRLHETGTARPIETYIENFKRSGDPLG